MAVDAAMVDMMTNPYRDLLDGIRSQGTTGPDVDAMAAALRDMRALAARHSDAGSYSMQLTNDGYFQRFIDAYTRVMTGGGQSNGATLPDDSTLLANTLRAYADALPRMRETPGEESAVVAVERILELGRSGLSYPRFLLQMEEERLGDVLLGSVTPPRSQLLDALEHARRTVDPAREAEAGDLVAARDALAAGSPTGSVDPFAWELASFRVRWQHAPAIARRDALVARLPRLLDLICEWLDAHTSWAAHDSRFIGATPASTQKRIEMARECNPGFYAVRWQQFVELFGPMPWWMRPELGEERSARRILWTDARMELLIDAVGACRPLATPPTELIARAEVFGPNSF
jgi:hypothetical protein